MSIQGKLQTLQRQYGIAQPIVDGSRSQTPEVRGPGIADVVSAQIISTSRGDCFMVETSLPLAHRHGIHQLAHLDRISGDRLAVIARDPELAYVDLAHAVFLDTETTGLSTGTGTYVFLVGLGFVDDGHFRIRQYFLEGPSEEPAFLTALHESLGSFRALITFNGKAFDWPLLESRFVRHRQVAPFRDPPHVDLLHPARRLWKRRLASCSLSSLEGAILGSRRTLDDVPGWDIPRRYFLYQRTGDASELQGVFYHNAQDILSLGSLAVHIDRVLSDPLGGLVKDAVDFLSLGKSYDFYGEAELAAACYDEAMARGLDGDNRTECLTRLSMVQKRQRWWEAALHSWYQLIEEGGAPALFALVEMAKFYEHVERDYVQALDVVRQAQILLELRTPMSEIDRLDLEHRYARLLNRGSSSRSPWRSRM